MVLCTLQLFSHNAWAKAWSSNGKPDSIVVYKEIDGQSLELHVFYPSTQKPAPAIAFFHGGGFKKGEPKAFHYACDYFAHRGMVAISVQYRLASGKDRLKCLMDAKSAIRYIKKNADKLRIDPEMIVSAGGSAGGCLAAAMATSRIINEKTDDLSITIDPVALVLFNPVGVGGSYSKGPWEESINNDFWPGRSICDNMPPTLAMWGGKDKFVSVKAMKEFQQKIRGKGGRCEIEIYPNEEHSFFDNTMEQVVNTLGRADTFLASMGILKGEPMVGKWAASVKKSP